MKTCSSMINKINGDLTLIRVEFFLLNNRLFFVNIHDKGYPVVIGEIWDIDNYFNLSNLLRHALKFKNSDYLNQYTGYFDLNRLGQLVGYYELF